MRTELRGFALFALLTLLLGCGSNGVSTSSAPARVPVLKSDVEALDGDTIRYKGSLVRLMGLDAPEGPWDESEAGYPSPFIGDQGEVAKSAADELRRLISSASKLELAFRQEDDRYGRKLAHLYVDGTTVAVPMIKAGLAYESATRYGAQGFPDEYDQILQAARQTGKPAFEDPHEWRRKNAKEPRND